MKINYFTSKYDNEVKLTEDVSWQDLTEMFSVHKVTEVKNDLGFILAEFKTTDYAPATRGIYDWIDGQEVEVAREVKLDEYGHTIVGRYAENVIAYHALVFDYDGNGIDIIKKTEEFIGFKHIGYTSHNHIISGVHKFRIILPFSEPCPINEWRLRQDAFREFGGVDDRSTTAMARIFFAPTCPEAGKQYASTWHMDGVELDWKLFEPKIEKIAEPVSVVPTSPTGQGKVRYDTLDMVQFFKDRGMYVAGNSQGKHDVRCFRQNEHLTNTAGGTVVWQKPGDWPSFYCGHSHSLTSKDFWEYYNKEEIEPYCQREEVIKLKTAEDFREYAARKIKEKENNNE